MTKSDPDWNAVLASTRFKQVARRRRNTIVVLGVLSALYYFSIPALIAWGPDVFRIRLAAGINLGTVFAVSQYPFGGLIAYVFMRRSAAIDRAAESLAPRVQSDAAFVEEHHAY
ncbi:DUF485 domain-containing protein [Paraburkholderia silvatlantica]|uniref:Uncharacterized membrane protein (DUF485 family) n=1 Tax=Paraburkholderia silvatlantica TaxID=321895 RepID=A0A2V4TNX1_9BURK|nr:DUF485 domain-containing protein [Paraburkholderia silvatlantica]PYE17292.1 uncharacterized membrane protein (DUF485 family) [Paraburkholderia silvatlantica]TDQ81106.1 uncharacterized membrane protein (DUF485 family) [Paraburkholderia silvatlantica]